MLELKTGNKYQRIGHPDSHIREIIDMDEANGLVTYKYFYPDNPNIYLVKLCYISDFIPETEPYVERRKIKNEISDTSH